MTNVMINKPFQRLASASNAHVGSAFENSAKIFFEKQGLSLQLDIKIAIGVNSVKKEHAFDLGCLNKKILVECKSHKWTQGDNVPSAKLTLWNEAMYYFLTSPEGFRKIMFVLRDYSEKRNETLAEYYLRSYRHLIPDDVELWEYDETKLTACKLCN